MDPSKVKADEIKNQRKTTIETIFRHLDEFHYKNLILLPYKYKYDCHLIIIAKFYLVNSNLHEDAYRFHWVLLIISIDNSNINVYDSLRKDHSEYQDLEDVFHEY
jgi:hypothetical protein